MDIRVFDQEFQFALLVVGIDGNGHCSDLGGGIQECKPVRDISRPDTDMRAMFDPDRKHAFRHPVYTFVEFLPGETEVAVGIYQILLVGCRLGPMFHPLAERLIL